MVKIVKVLETKRNVSVKKVTEKSKPAESKKDDESMIRETAYFLSKKGLSYNDLCWILAEKQLNVLNAEQGKIKAEDIKKKAEEINKSSKKYADLCWFIAKIEITNKI